MDKEFWIRRWQDGLTGWHCKDFNKSLVTNAQTIFMDQSLPIFVPLCGKSRDMLWLLKQGYSVVACELSHKAVLEFFTENQIPYSVTSTPAFQVFTSCNVQQPIKILQGDIFQLSGEVLGAISGIYDRAAYIALNQEQRKEYAKIISKIGHNKPILLETIDYPQCKVDGPPFSISRQEITAYFSLKKIACLVEDPCEKMQSPRFVAAGLDQVILRVFKLS